MSKNKQINPEDVQLKLSDYLSNDPDHPRDSGELAFLLNVDARGIRAMAQRERLEGIPIIANERGYYIAPTKEAFLAYIHKRQRWLDKEKKDIKLSEIAVTARGYFWQ